MLSNWTTPIIFEMRNRELFFFKDYFKEFFEKQQPKMKDKIRYVFRLITELENIPIIYFKHLADTDGLYEIRVQHGNNAVRIFCFFDSGNIVVVGNGFSKKN